MAKIEVNPFACFICVVYDVYSGIQIKVSSAIEDLGDIIEAYEADDGKRYLKIRMDNDTTFRTFERREGR